MLDVKFHKWGGCLCSQISPFVKYTYLVIDLCFLSIYVISIFKAITSFNSFYHILWNFDFSGITFNHFTSLLAEPIVFMITILKLETTWYIFEISTSTFLAFPIFIYGEPSVISNNILIIFKAFLDLYQAENWQYCYEKYLALIILTKT